VGRRGRGRSGQASGLGMRARGVGRFAVWVAVAGVLAWAIVLAEPAAEAHPVGTSDRQAYELATGGRFPWLPVQHVEYRDAEVGAGEADGYCAPEQSLVTVVLRSGSLPRDEYVAILRHEYGHALLYTWCTSCGCGEDGFLETLQFTPTGGAGLPEGLRGPAKDYRADPGYFGSYARRSLCEWLAEAYAGYVAGDGIPEATSEFFDTLSRAKTVEAARQ
jgi:hypothetical protein